MHSVCKDHAPESLPSVPGKKEQQPRASSQASPTAMNLFHFRQSIRLILNSEDFLGISTGNRFRRDAGIDRSTTERSRSVPH